jgi:hypothetical protein
LDDIVQILIGLWYRPVDCSGHKAVLVVPYQIGLACHKCFNPSVAVARSSPHPIRDLLAHLLDYPACESAWDPDADRHRHRVDLAR